MAWVHRQAVAVFGNATQRVDVADVELGVDAKCKQVHREVHDVDVAGALTVAEQGALNAIGTSHHAKLGCGNTGAAVVVWMQADDHARAVTDVATEPLDDIAVDIGGVALDGGGQVEDDGQFGGGLDDVHHGMANVERVLRLGEREALGGVLVTNLAADQGLLELAGELCGVDRDIDDAALIEVEHHFALQRIGAVVEVNNGLVHALQAFVGALEQLLAALHQNLNGHVVGDEIFFDELAYEIEVGLACGREAHLNLFESHLHQRVEHAPLAIWIHWINQRLVAVAEVDTAPQRGFGHAHVGPRAVGEHQG